MDTVLNLALSLEAIFLIERAARLEPFLALLVVCLVVLLDTVMNMEMRPMTDEEKAPFLAEHPELDETDEQHRRGDD